MLVLATSIPSHAMLTISKMAKWIDSVSGQCTDCCALDKLSSKYFRFIFFQNGENALNLGREIRD